MTAYGVLRLIHGYWRWIVLLSGFVAVWRAVVGLTRRRAFTAGDGRASRWFVSAVDLQLLLGLILYFAFSPFWSAVHGSFHVAMHDPTTRFFGIEHETAMLFAFIVVHVGRVRIRRAADAATKHRALLVSSLIFFALAAWAIPWPSRSVARPLFRTAL